MTEWTSPPEPVTWELSAPADGQQTFRAVTLRAPTAEEVMTAFAIPGSQMSSSLRLIEAVSGVPFDVLKKLPSWQIEQMVGYIEEFSGTPAPGPLASWREARRLAAAPSSAPSSGAAAA